MPTRMPGGVFVGTADWEALLAYLGRLGSAVEAATAATAATGACDTRLRRLEEITGSPMWHREGNEGLIAAVETLDRRVARLEERLGPRLGHQVEEIHLAVHRPGERPRTVGGGLAAAVATLEQAVRALAEASGRQQGGAASVAGALERLAGRIAALERRHGELLTEVAALAAAQRASGDQLAGLLIQQQARLEGNDALTLLARLLASPREVAPLFRRDQFVCFVPERVRRWLIDKGLTRREAEQARSVWRDAGYVSSERKDNHNKRVKIAGAASPPYFMVVPTLTYARLRLPIPPDLPTEPPRGTATA